MQHIETVTVGAGGAASITFSAIPDTFTDLYLVFSARSTGSATGAYFTFNGSTANFSGRFLQGSGSSANSGTEAQRAGYVTGTDQTASTFASNAVYIPNYTASVAKSYSVDHVQENNGTISYQGIYAGLWNQTVAITSIALTNPTGNFAEYSSASLYGITAGSDGITSVA